MFRCSKDRQDYYPDFCGQKCGKKVAKCGKNGPFLSFDKKIKLPQFHKTEMPITSEASRLWAFFGGEQGIRTLEQALTCYTISSRAPSASSDNSPCLLFDKGYYIKFAVKNQVKIPFF